MSQNCAPGASCAMSNGQQGGITAGTINVGAPPLKLEWTVKPLASDRFQHAQQVTVTANVAFQPVSLVIECDQEIEDVEPSGIMFRPDAGITQQSNKIGYVYYESPPLAPGVKLTIGVFSKSPFSILDVRPAAITPRKNVADGP